MKFGVADYGLSVYEGGSYDLEDRLQKLKAIGYQGLEHCPAISASQALHNAARFRRLGMGFATCSAPSPMAAMEWTAALGKEYVWVSSRSKDFDVFCRHIDVQLAACRRWGIRGALHNHLGTQVESQKQLETFLDRCPDSGLILDTAHLAAAGGNCVAIVNKYAGRLAAVHLKDWLITNPGAPADRLAERGRFCELGAGNAGLDNLAVMAALKASGYDGWIFVEQDVHLRDPFQDLAASRAYLRNAGY